VGADKADVPGAVAGVWTLALVVTADQTINRGRLHERQYTTPCTNAPSVHRRGAVTGADAISAEILGGLRIVRCAEMLVPVLPLWFWHAGADAPDADADLSSELART
jgi:hypothetical protein